MVAEVAAVSLLEPTGNLQGYGPSKGQDSKDKGFISDGHSGTDFQSSVFELSGGVKGT